MIMKDEFISLFIDDAMTLDEKIEFIELIHTDKAYKDDTVLFLQQESTLRSDVTQTTPVVDIGAGTRFNVYIRRTWGYLATAAATACIIFFLTFQSPVTATVPFRFVLYQPEAKQVQLSGSFTDWQAVTMNRIGDSGYWDITVGIPRGEHQFSYILNGEKTLADPSIPAREKDDFGGENSILVVGV
jgi:hypothetical protein